MKKCIFHYPGPIQDSPVTGSGVRPRKMLEAFYTLGFDVTVVSGYSRERKKIMRQIADNMSSGVKYEFVYSESTTMPTALSDEDHLPRNPFMDEFFLGYCKRIMFQLDCFIEMPTGSLITTGKVQKNGFRM